MEGTGFWIELRTVAVHTTDSCAVEHEAPKGGHDRWRTVGGTRQRALWFFSRWRGHCHVLDHEVPGTRPLLPLMDRTLCNAGGKCGESICGSEYVY